MKKSIIIIGAGVAGLSAGCYARMNGYNTQIFEMHNIPGGVCTTWERKGYKIDGCIHWLTGIKSRNSFYPIFKELGILQGREMVVHEDYARIEGQNGKIFVVHTDIDRLEQHMKELAPEDKEAIEDFTNGIRNCINFPLPIEKPNDLFNFIDVIKLIRKMRPYFKVLKKWGNVTIQDASKYFQNPFLREVFPFIFNLQNPPTFPMLAILTTFAWMHQKVCGYPIGGSLELSKSIEKRYLSLGGKIHYRSRVVKILVENDRAVGVRLANGAEYHSDIIISAADGHTTIFNMLDGKYINKKIKNYYDHMPTYKPLVYIGLGVARSFEEIPPTVTGTDFPLNEPITIGGQERNRLSFQIYNFDPTLAPAGKSFIRVHFASDYDYWKKLRIDSERYKDEKEKIASQVIASLDKRFPGLANQVEMYDVATPITFERYTGNWKGSFQGWEESVKTLRLQMKKTLPRLKNFYMTGHWVQPGGSIPSSVMSGRHVAQIICKVDKNKFNSYNP
ncbi:MAG: phytoene desaturase family protein [Candidatus Hermodarchaeota archaeon]